MGLRGGHMLAQSYDIFRREMGGEVWVEAVRDLEAAKSRIIELSAEKPGQYVVLSKRSGRMVSSGTVVASPEARRGKNFAEMESETLW